MRIVFLVWFSKRAWAACGLTKQPEDWPVTTENYRTPESLIEEKKTVTAMLTGTEVGTGVSSVIHINDYSSLQRLVRATAWVKRFLHNTSAKERRTGRLEIYELKGAESDWLKSVQVDLKKQDNFKQFVGEFGIKEHQEILRCEGRLLNSDLDSEARKPVILP